MQLFVINIQSSRKLSWFGRNNFICVLVQWITDTNLEWHAKDKEHEKLHLEIHLNLNSLSLKGQNCAISIPVEY